MLELLRSRRPSSSSLHALHRRRRARLRVEELEARCLLSVFTPAQIRHAYGFDQISFSANGRTIAGDGTGQTIAIVDAFDDPNIASDLQHFNRVFGLPDSAFTKLSPTGVLPRADADWAREISLDVEWAHAIAPGASILLVEAASDSLADLLSAVSFAAQQPGVDVVSMSWGGNEFAGQTQFDHVFTTPAGHNGVTFVASSGDGGAFSGVSWPASSPNVLSVGGTALRVLGSNGTYGSESGWSGSTGGFSAFESEPSWQLSLQNSGVRTTPDVSYVGNPSTSVYVYDSYALGAQAGWFALGGTSVGAPQWAALIAIADQGLALSGKPSLDGPSQTLPALYSLAQASPTAYFHDVTRGFSGYSALPGYDLVTGLGSPKANALVNGLVTGNSARVTSVAKTQTAVAAAGKAAAAVETASGTALFLVNDHRFLATPAGVVTVPSTGQSSLLAPATMDPSLLPSAAPVPRPLQVRVESGGGDNGLLPADQDQGPQPMDGVPDLSGSGTAPRMAPEAPTGPVRRDHVPGASSQKDRIPRSGAGRNIDSSSPETVEESLGGGTPLKALAAVMGFGLVLGSYGRRARSAWTRGRGKPSCRE